jgi:hypothetical protein
MPRNYDCSCYTGGMPAPSHNELVGVLADIDQLIELARESVENSSSDEARYEALTCLRQMKRSRRAVEACLTTALASRRFS